jgi:nucleoside-diphosphate-sugar epimerase
LTTANTFAGQPVLVTGASGFIGAHLCHALTVSGATVHAISRSPAPADSALHWWQADLSDYAALERIFADIRPVYVFHLASEVTGSRERKVVLPTLHSNLVSTVNLLNLATEYACERLILAGSLEEAQANSAPSSPYAAAKSAASAYAQMFHNLYQTPLVTARLFMVYGPAQRDITKLIPYVTLQLLRGEVPKMSSGTRPVDWIYVADVVDGLLKCALTPGIDGQTIDLGSGQLVTIHDMVQTLAGIVSAEARLAFGALPDRPFEQVRAANTADSLARIGWQPRVSLTDGLAATVAYYRRQLAGDLPL